MNLSESNWVPQDKRNELREGFGDESKIGTKKEQYNGTNYSE